jgi:hypothetical protein
MPATEGPPILKCDNLIVSPRGVTEAHARKVILFVPAAEINRITLKFGRSDHRPVFTATMGILLSLAGIFGLVELILAPRGLRYELAMITLGVIGGSMIFDSLKQRYFFEVAKNNDMCRLVFSRRAQLNDIREFCQQVRTHYKHEITEEV